jgi:hypothetical protein
LIAGLSEESMPSRSVSDAARFAFGSVLVLILAGCGAGSGETIRTLPAMAQTQATDTRAVIAATTTLATAGGVTNRRNFVGAFFRAEGSPPYGVFAAKATQTAPVPYPTPGAALLGKAGYCDQIAANGASIDGSYAVDETKMYDLISVGARWSRMPVSQYFVDHSHVFGPGQYAFGSMDAAQCVSYFYHNIRPVIGLEAGPVQYNATPGAFSPVDVPAYKTAADFGQWCGVVAAHERAVFPTVTQFSLPGNEVNTNPELFPGGIPQIAAYSKACYGAVKAANPSAFVYGFELNMVAGGNAANFVSQLVALGCRVGTCYDGIAIHLNLRYPIPPASTPCYPNPGGDYSMRCVTDIETAAKAPIHVLVSETEYTVPGSVPDEQTKATAIVAAFTAFAADPTVDGVSYANIDECALYPSGYFYNGCLIDTSGNALPGLYALQWLTAQHFL